MSQLEILKKDYLKRNQTRDEYNYAVRNLVLRFGFTKKRASQIVTGWSK